MLVQVVIFALERCLAAVPCAGVDEEFAFECQKMWIAGVTLFDAKAVHLLPLFRIGAREDDDRRGGMDHVAVRTATKHQVERAFKSDEVREGVMLSIIKHPTNVADSHLGQLTGLYLHW